MFFDYTSYHLYFKIALIVYIPIVFSTKYLIDNYLSKQNKEYLSELLKLPWACWCFTLSIFSLFGTYYTGKYLLLDGFKTNLFNSNASIFYHLFILSKIPELIDTLFMVLRSKPIVALQWYHHWVTLAICYYVTYLQCDKIVILFFMNYFVHTFMYFYFGLYCFHQGKIMRKVFGTFVNLIQTIQMFLAVIISIYLYNFEIDTMVCVHKVTYDNLTSIYYFGILMYISYLVLFIQVFYERTKRLESKNV